MSFSDEKIIAMLSKMEDLQHAKRIGEGPIHIGQRSYDFEQQAFYEDKLLVYIPKDFTDMPDHMSAIKYPHTQRPQIIKMNEDGSINITLSRIDQDLEDDWVQELTEGMMAILRKVNPSNVFFTNGIEEIHGKTAGYFEFKSPALDTFLYNLMFFMELDGKTLMGTFSCKYSDYEAWRDTAFEMMRAVRVIQEEEGGEQE
ncbi:hypothetical protein [Paenibacillus sp. FJAT-26967]|uniref:hypothetical protein n=1 Tax=Paenibacillus sp. FJAT-26967 TaxID=1729690 RepID=UPI000838C447|nr:hypothetical protein [Paenibacillus sp. FJAT-26967]